MPEAINDPYAGSPTNTLLRLLLPTVSVAAFFIDARAEISVAESRFGLQVKEGAASRRTPSPGPRERALSLVPSAG